MKPVSQKPYLLISACLLGEGCRYDGAKKPPLDTLAQLRERFVLLPICPEVSGGLPTPRPPAERVGARVLRCDGVDITVAYARGAALACTLAQKYGATAALLKSKSPSCGKGYIYDGSFSRTLCERDGVTAEALQQLGVHVFCEAEVAQLLCFDEKK